MNEHTDDAVSNEAAGPRAGERLAEARQALDISLRDIAKELHLDEAKVQALEENRFDALGPPVFAKGHLRKYAELVGVAVDDVLADYYHLHRATAPPPLVTTRRAPTSGVSVGAWVAVVAVLLAAAVAAWWWLSDAPMQPETSEPAPAPDAGIRTEAEAQRAGTRPSAASEAGDPAAAPGVVNAAPVAAGQSIADAARGQAAAQTPAPDPSSVTLRLSYTGDCWTEISDASGRRLFFDLGRAGRVVNVTGEPPLHVLFGSSDNVSLSVEGVPYAIRAADRRGNTARLTIGGPG